MPRIQTVLGDIDPKALGPTLVHEHTLLAWGGWQADPRLAFDREGMLYMSAGAANAPASTGPYAKSRGGRAQDPMSHGGKILRLRDDGLRPTCRRPTTS